MSVVTQSPDIQVVSFAFQSFPNGTGSVFLRALLIIITKEGREGEFGRRSVQP